MKEIDELREWVTYKSTLSSHNEQYTLSKLDAIEQAIAERYMELPLDADAVPIHVGDSMVPWNGEGQTVVAAVCEDGFADENVPMHFAPNMHHAKPDTIEDALRDFAYNVCDLLVDEDAVGIYAERIREVMRDA